MRLRVKRSQREAGVLAKTVVFCLDARVEFTPEEAKSLERYRLWGQVIYNSEASQRALERAQAASEEASMADWRYLGSVAKSLAYTALAGMHLNISITSLAKGQHIECKSLDELLGAEEAVMTACENLKGYLDTAATFDGREVLIDFATGKPEVIAQAEALPPLAALPAAPSQQPQYELIDGVAYPPKSPGIGGPAPDSWAAHEAAKQAKPKFESVDEGMVVAPIGVRRRRSH